VRLDERIYNAGELRWLPLPFPGFSAQQRSIQEIAPNLSLTPIIKIESAFLKE